MTTEKEGVSFPIPLYSPLPPSPNFPGFFEALTASLKVLPASLETLSASLKALSASFEVLSIAYGNLYMYTSSASPSTTTNRSDSTTSSCSHLWIHHFFEVFGFRFFKLRSIKFKKLHPQMCHSTLLLIHTASIRHQSRLHLTNMHWRIAYTCPRVDLTHWRMAYKCQHVDNPSLHVLPPITSFVVFRLCFRSPKVVFSLPATLIRSMATTRRSVGSKIATFRLYPVLVLLCCFCFF
jgi:hypothetical protein